MSKYSVWCFFINLEVSVESLAWVVVCKPVLCQQEMLSVATIERDAALKQAKERHTELMSRADAQRLQPAKDSFWDSPESGPPPQLPSGGMQDPASRPQRDSAAWDDLEQRYAAAEAALGQSISQEQFQEHLAALQAQIEAQARQQFQLLEAEHSDEVAALKTSIAHLNGVINRITSSQDDGATSNASMAAEQPGQVTDANVQLQAEVKHLEQALAEKDALLSQHAQERQRLQRLHEQQAADQQKELAALAHKLAQRDAQMQDLEHRLASLRQELTQEHTGKLAAIEVQHRQSLAELEDEIQAVTAVAEARSELAANANLQLQSQREQLEMHHRQALLGLHAEHSQALEGLQADHALELARLEADRDVAMEHMENVAAALRADLDQANAQLKAATAAQCGATDPLQPVNHASDPQELNLLNGGHTRQQSSAVAAHQQSFSKQQLLLLFMSILNWRHHHEPQRAAGRVASDAAAAGLPRASPDAACHITLETSSQMTDLAAGVQDPSSGKAMQEVQESLQEKHAQSLAAHEEKHSAELLQLSAAHEMELEMVKQDLSSRHEAEMAETLAAHQQQMTALRDGLTAQHEQELVSLRASHAQEIAELHKAAQTQQDQHKEHASQLVTTQQQEISTLSSRHEQEKVSLQQAMQAEQQQIARQMTAHHQLELTALREEVDRMTQQGIEPQNMHYADLAAVLATHIEDGILQAQRLRSEHARELQELKSELEKQCLALQEHQHESQQKLESAVNASVSDMKAQDEFAARELASAMRALHAAEMQQALARHQLEVTELAAQHSAAIEALRHGHELQQSDCRERHQLELDEALAGRAQQLDEVTSGHAQQLEVHAAEMLACQEELAQIKQTLEHCRRDGSEAKDRLAHMLSRHESELAACRAQHEQEIKELRARLQQIQRSAGSGSDMPGESHRQNAEDLQHGMQQEPKQADGHEVLQAALQVPNVIIRWEVCVGLRS